LKSFDNDALLLRNFHVVFHVFFPSFFQVNVTLPQLKPDYEKLAQQLYTIGSSKTVKSKQRELLYELSKQFKDLAQDVYPLAPNDLEEVEAKIPKVKVSKITARRVKEELNR